MTTYGIPWGLRAILINGIAQHSESLVSNGGSVYSLAQALNPREGMLYSAQIYQQSAYDCEVGHFDDMIIIIGDYGQWTAFRYTPEDVSLHNTFYTLSYLWSPAITGYITAKQIGNEYMTGLQKFDPHTQ